MGRKMGRETMLDTGEMLESARISAGKGAGSKELSWRGEQVYGDVKGLLAT